MAEPFVLADRAEGDGIIAREEVLMPEHYPSGLLHREAELTEIADAVKPMLDNRQPENLFIYGDSGTGKTVCVKNVVKNLGEHSSRVKTVYANCWHHSTRMAVYSLVAGALDVMIPRRGLATDEVFTSITQAMEAEGTKVVLVLDELEGLFFHGEEQLLYDLARAGRGKPFFGIITIANDPYLLVQKDMRIKSSVRLADFQFRHYTNAQMVDILTERAFAGLAPGSWDEDVIGACAAKAMARKSNVRVGLELLWRAAKHVEKSGRRHITPEDVKGADAKTSYEPKKGRQMTIPSFEFRNTSLGDEERIILDILKTGDKQSSEFYLALCKKLMRTKRLIRNYLHELVAKKLIRIEEMPGSNPMLNGKKISLNVGGAAQ